MRLTRVGLTLSIAGFSGVHSQGILAADILEKTCVRQAADDELDTTNSCTQEKQLENIGHPHQDALIAPNTPGKLLAAKVPVIDISALMEPDPLSTEEWDKAAEAVARACEEWGFFQAVNHGIPPVLLDSVISKGREMFALPKSVKSKIKRTASNARGWYDDELTKQTRDWKEGFDVGHVPEPKLPPDHPSNVVVEGYNQWPSPGTVPGFKETMDAFYSAATTVATQLMKGIATNLGLPRSYFAPSFEPQTSYLRLNYYPPCPEPCDSLSVNRHSDAGALTVLLQEPGSTALQVNHQFSGRWVSIPPMEGALTINVGDMLQVWSNDLFRAPEHRVLSQTNRDRFSAPFFYNPAYHADIAPLPGAAAKAPGAAATQHQGDLIVVETQPSAEKGISAQEVARYRPVNWREFRLSRFAGDYADQGTDEVQISHYLLESEDP